MTKHEQFMLAMDNFLASELPAQIDAIESATHPPINVLQALGKFKTFGLLVAQADGGWGLTAETVKTALWQLALQTPSLAVVMGVPFITTTMIARYGSEAIKQRVLPALITGQRFCAFALSEKNNHEQSSLSTTFYQQDNHYAVTGHKHMISWAGLADYYLTIGNLEINERTHRPTALLVEAGCHGLKATPDEKSYAFPGLVVGGIHYNQCQVDQTCLLGKIGLGLTVADEAIQLGRLCLSAVALAMTSRLLTTIKKHIGQKQTQSATGGTIPLIQVNFADLMIQYHAATSLLDRAWQLWASHDRERGVVINMAKVNASRIVMGAAEQASRCLQNEAERPTQQLAADFQQAKLFGVMEGSYEVLMRHIARQFLAHDHE